jgi:hypothetical protein
MNRTAHLTTVAAITLLGAACQEFNSPRTTLAPSLALASAFSTVPAGFDSTSNTFSAATDSAGPWRPRGGGEGPGFGFMGGGLGLDFDGGMDFGPGRGRGPFHPLGGPGFLCTGTFSAATGRVACDSVTRNGITVVRSIAYADAAGAVQSAFDTITTNTVNTRTAVSGTTTRVRRDGDSATAIVTHSSDRTVTGLAQGSTQRTVNGTSAGREDVAGTDSTGTYIAVRVVGDTTSGIIVPVVSGKPTYPTAGMVIRSMKVTLTYAGQASTTSSRREVITYDGSATAKVVITTNGTTQNCTLPLPRGRPSCS